MKIVRNYKISFSYYGGYWGNIDEKTVDNMMKWSSDDSKSGFDVHNSRLIIII